MTRALLVFLLLALTSRLSAHEVRPAYLELHQVESEVYNVFWKVPGLGDNLRLGLYVELPPPCKNSIRSQGSMTNNAYSERWTVKCVGGLAGKTINISGLGATKTDALVRLERLDGTSQVTRATPSNPSFVVEAAPKALEVAGTYLRLGTEHILFGVDHLLFVLTLLILVKGVRRLIATVTAFTLAHSLTLAGATLGYVHVPGPPVEASIALSIVFVAAETIRSRDGVLGLTERFPWLAAFTFGLLHGFGFASALSEVGLPQSAIPIALLFFNVGVEVGQLLFVAVMLGLIRVWPGWRTRKASRWAALAPSYLIGCVSMFWVIQRIAAF